MNKEQFKELMITIKIGFALLFTTNVMILRLYNALDFMLVVWLVVGVVLMYLFIAIIKFMTKE